jgi:tRNA 2-selenouridine synthase
MLERKAARYLAISWKDRISFTDMNTELDISSFLQKSAQILVLDVRTPAEYQQGHIPEAISFPLFQDDERTTIGTLYKQKGREKAILKSIEITGPKMFRFASQARKLTRNNQLMLHCWRGGMRSSSMAWIIGLTGIITFTLKDGYKAYRNYVLDKFNDPLNLIVLGGKTGSGKTEILRVLRKKGEQIIDLEAIAHHKGSAFGALGEQCQNRNEQFENDLAWHIDKLNPYKTTWIEDESRTLGINTLPAGLFNQIRSARLVYLDAEKSFRIKRLVVDYASFGTSELEECIGKISQRLGGLNTKNAIEALKNKDFKKVAETVLSYYDKTYNYGLGKRNPETVHKIFLSEDNFDSISEEIINYGKRLH